jgi:hypothetical protein
MTYENIIAEIQKGGFPIFITTRITPEQVKEIKSLLKERKRKIKQFCKQETTRIDEYFMSNVKSQCPMETIKYQEILNLYIH